VEINDLYCSLNTVRVIETRKMRWAGHVARVRERRVVYRVLLGKPEGKRLLVRPRSRWEDTIERNLLEVGCGGVDWIELTKDKDKLRARVCGDEHSGSIKCGKVLD